MDGISVIIPTYNEREAITACIQTITRELVSLREIIVVDDDSPDGTWRVAQDLSASDSRIKIIRRVARHGLVNALREGIAVSAGEYVFCIDADFCAQPGTLAAIAASCVECDIAFASRYSAGGRDLRDERLRVFFSRVFNFTARRVLGMHSRDLTSGQVIFRRSVCDAIPIEGDYGEYFVRFLFKAEQKGLRIREVPFSTFSRIHGKSKTTSSVAGFIKKGLRYILTVVQLKFSRKGN